MNLAIISGRLTRDPEVRYSQGAEPMTIAHYTIAVDRKKSKNSNSNEPTADFIRVVAFGKTGEFVSNYLKKGTKIQVTGRIQTGSYTDKDGIKRDTFEIVATDHEFCESKNASQNTQASPQIDTSEGFMNISAGIQAELPFN